MTAPGRVGGLLYGINNADHVSERVVEDAVALMTQCAVCQLSRVSMAAGSLLTHPLSCALPSRSFTLEGTKAAHASALIDSAERSKPYIMSPSFPLLVSSLCCAGAGTDSEELLGSPFYVGARHQRVRGEAYDELLAELLEAVKLRFGNSTLIHFQVRSPD